jgi:hypothetical protein
VLVHLTRGHFSRQLTPGVMHMGKNNSWKKLDGLPSAVQMRIAATCSIKALKHYQTWLSMIFLAVVAYITTKVGIATGLKIGVVNIVGLAGAAIGGLVFGMVMNKYAVNHIEEELNAYKKQEKET